MRITTLLIAIFVCDSTIVVSAMAPEAVKSPGDQRRTVDAGLLADLDPLKTESPFKPLGKSQVWLDAKRKVLVADGVICLTEGQLELFACPKGTKEHESVVSLFTDAMTIHAGLLAIGAESGSPVKYDPEYAPATGPVVDMYLIWTDKEGKRQQARAQQWVRNVRSKKELDIDWVFAGSAFSVDPDTGEKYYLANVGDLVCVSNFATATLDLPVKSSQENADLMFEAFKERIPAKGTKIRMVFLPRPPRKSDPPPARPKTP